MSVRPAALVLNVARVVTEVLFLATSNTVPITMEKLVVKWVVPNTLPLESRITDPMGPPLGCRMAR